MSQPEQESNTDFHRAEALMQRFFEGNISETEGQELLRLWDSLPDFDDYALKNLDSEFILQLMATQEKRPTTFQVRRQRVIRPNTGIVTLDHLPSNYTANDTSNDASADENREQEKVVAPNWEEIIALAVNSTPIERQAELDPQPVVSKKPNVPAKVKEQNLGRILILAPLLVVMFSLGVWMEFFSSSAPRRAGVPFQSNGNFYPIAQVTASVDVQWPKDVDRIKTGQYLERSRLRFEKGTLELKLKNDVRIALEGPVDFLLETPERTYLDQGRLSATVTKKGKGFSVGTPCFTLVDHGTEFSLAVSKTESETHTLTGRTEVRLGDNHGREILEGDAIRVDEQKNLKTIPFNPSIFLSEEIVQDRVSEESLEKIGRWRNTAAKWNADPSLLFRFDFENVTRSIPNVADRRAVASGRLVGTRSARGRWMGKHAIVFNRKSDAIAIELSKPTHSMTLIASVRIDSLNRFAHCLLAGDTLEPGSLFWQLGNDGTIKLSVQPPNEKTAVEFSSPSVLSRRHLGTWCQIATVLDAENKTVVHYLDGQSVAVLNYDEPLPIKLESMTLGNGIWKSRTVVDRSFQGCFDDFLLFERALSSEEIQAFYIP